MKLFRLIDQEETMRCPKTKLISSYIDGELSAEERALETKMSPNRGKSFGDKDESK